jgi:hypothetical protein
MVRTLLCLLALLLVVTVPVTALAGDDEESEDDDEAPGIPPWLGDDDDDDDDDDGEGEEPADEDPDGSLGKTPAPAAPAPPTAPPVAPPRSFVGSQMSASDLGTLKGGGLFGIGVAAGTINGLTLKIWPSRPHGIVLHLGAHPSVLNAMVVGLGYRIHVKPIIIPSAGMALHFNLGPALRTRMVFFTNGTFIELAGGVAFGVSATMAKVPLELFVEAIPGYGGGISPAGVGLGFSVDGIVGLRVFLGK